MNIIKETMNGRIFKCNKCNAIHLEYKNLNFNFSEKDFNNFIKYFQEIDADFCEKTNSNSEFKRKIILPIGHQNFNILFDKNEFKEFKELLIQKEQKEHHYLEIIENKEVFEVQYLN